MIIQGMCYKYGDDINTDVIYPGRYTYLTLSDEEIASHALEDLDPTFAQRVQPGDILVGGWNWGVGSAREQAVKCLVFKGVRAIIAKSFARIYFRNCLNEGLLAIACPDAAQAAVDGEKVTIDLTRSEIIIGQQNFAFEPYPEYVRGLVEAGGIIPYTLQKLHRGTSLNKGEGRDGTAV